jgi:hypothetical protein
MLPLRSVTSLPLTTLAPEDVESHGRRMPAKSGRLTDDDTRPQNMMHISVRERGLDVTCLSLQGVDHLGAGDVDCGKDRL